MFCRSCGVKLKEGLNFCTNCGANLNSNVNIPITRNNDIIGNSSIVKEKVIKVDKEDDKPLAREGLIIGLVLCVLIVSITSIFIVSYYARDFEPKYYEKEI